MIVMSSQYMRKNAGVLSPAKNRCFISYGLLISMVCLDSSLDSSLDCSSCYSNGPADSGMADREGMTASSMGAAGSEYYSEGTDSEIG